MRRRKDKIRIQNTTQDTLLEKRHPCQIFEAVRPEKDSGCLQFFEIQRTNNKS